MQIWPMHLVIASEVPEIVTDLSSEFGSQLAKTIDAPEFSSRSFLVLLHFPRMTAHWCDENSTVSAWPRSVSLSY